MPKESEWSTFFDPAHVLKTLGLNNAVHDVADFGCGYGTFTIPAAQIVSGTTYAIDVDSDKIQILQQNIQDYGISNVVILEQDIFHTDLHHESVDYVLLFNILHTQHPLELLTEAYRVLLKNGVVAIVHWNRDPDTPRGPPMKMRPNVDQCVEWGITTGFNRISARVYDLQPYHYGITMNK
jgi:ubiquinone/menaquinone biosynthesis C-methylase UbiE